MSQDEGCGNAHPMDSTWIKIKFSLKAIWYNVSTLYRDLWLYFVSPYPVLLVIGAWRRIRRRLKAIWCPRKSKGRSPIREDFIDLILEMKRSNWSWGALRIAQELALLGISLHKKTVQRILKENGLVPPRTKITPPTWSAFLKAHKHLWVLDFTCIFDSQGLQVFILAVIDLQTRQLVSINATLNPCREWITQQICNAELGGFMLPEGLIADNDAIFGKWLAHDFQRYFGIKVCHTPPASPWCNGICERFHLSLKREVLRRIGPTTTENIRHFCWAYQHYYNCLRPHQGINGHTPIQGSLPQCQLTKAPLRFRKISHIDGLVTQFELAA